MTHEEFESIKEEAIVVYEWSLGPRLVNELGKIGPYSKGYRMFYSFVDIPLLVNASEVRYPTPEEKVEWL